MRISEDARLCSVFIGHADPNDETRLSRIEGTAFLVAHEGCSHIVTAAHVARTLSGSPIAIRLTGPDGCARVLEIDEPVWRFHADRSVDVAVMAINAPLWTKTTAMPTDEFVDARILRDWEIGPGDAVYVVGLFNLHVGKHRNLPVVHAGNIALMPSDEKIPVKSADGHGVEEVEGYLVEAHALPGASGSPVMVRPTVRFVAEHVADGLDVWSRPPTMPGSLTFAESRDFFLGVWIAAWPGPPDDAMRKALNLTKDAWVSVGMGIVVPAERLLEIIRSDQVSEDRRSLP